MKRFLIPGGALVVLWQLSAWAAQPAPEPDLSGFRTLDKAITARVSLAAVAGPRSAAYLGIHVKKDGPVLTVSEVQAASPAAGAGLRVGDTLLKVDGSALATPEALRELLQSKGPGEKVTLTLLREQEPMEVTVALSALSKLVPGAKGGGGKGFGKGPKRGGPPPDAPAQIWRQDVYRLAVVVIDFTDTKHNDKITPANWEEALFSRDTYKKTSATGQTVYGSLNDYFHEQSYGKFRLTGKVFAPVQVAKKRGEYAQGTGTGFAARVALLTEALGKLEARDGKDALKDFDGLCFIYAGQRIKTNRGNLYYPHSGPITFQNKRWSYWLAPEGGSRMESISVFAFGVGKLLGLPELAARTENAGSEGLGVWCLMSDGAGDSGRPLHLCAWSKEQLGWLTPTIVDPTTRQKLILSPVLTSLKECLKVLVRLDGTEYFLLENRTAKGFDASLPAHGLLVWRVVRGRPILEESHGVTGPTGPRVHLSSVPYPSKSNNAFTPSTTPSSVSVAGGGLPVHVTNIRRLSDGRITLFLGYEYY
ncbi:MAG: M6 family metalloprotease domain-containing protein [Gemmataceae bacterium]|nr:M6 family metalloprotease domain-containing protein [Gemmataceae bacterium]